MLEAERYCGYLQFAGVPSARRRSPRMGTVYTALTLYLLMIWWGYPIVWGLAEGSNTITIDAEVPFLWPACCQGCTLQIWVLGHSST